jgi:Multicopper oxidase
LTRIAGKPAAGILKDMVMVPARNQVEVDVMASNRGPSLLHCHMQLRFKRLGLPQANLLADGPKATEPDDS